MRTPRLSLAPAQEDELVHLRDHHPTPYVRERAAALLQIAAGASARQVALHGLVRPRGPKTVQTWLRRYHAQGAAGLRVQPGRGRKPAFSPPDGRRRASSPGGGHPPVAPVVRPGAQPLVAGRAAPGGALAGPL